MNEPTPQPVREGIVSIPMPAVSHLVSSLTAVATLMFLLSGVGMILLLQVLVALPISPDVGILMAFFACLCLLVCGYVIGREYRSEWWRLVANCLPDDPKYPIMQGIDATGLMGVRSAFRMRTVHATRLVERLNASEQAIPRTIIPESLKDELLAIPLTADALEPSRINFSTCQPRLGNEVALIGLFLVSVSTLVAGKWWGAGLYAAMAGILAWGSVWFSRFTRRYRIVKYLPIAWPGGVSNYENRRWTVRDSVMIVRGATPGGEVSIDLLNRQRRLHLVFPSTRDADFVTLWQRWNHPDPRPELLP